MSYNLLKEYNRIEQYKEAAKLSNTINKERMKRYLSSKPALDQTAMRRLEYIAEVKVA